MTAGRCVRTVALPAAPPEVWAAITDPARLSQWFGAEIASCEARAGGRAEFSWAGGTKRGAIVEVADPPHLLALRWLPFERAPDGTSIVRSPTRVEFVLEESPHGTLLTVTESASFGSDPIASSMGSRRPADGVLTRRLDDWGPRAALSAVGATAEGSPAARETRT